LMRPLGVLGAAEEKFEVLKIGTQTYTNVTVTTKAKNYIFILHASGMTNLKIAELPLDLQQKLGYAAVPAANGPTNATVAWARKGIARMDAPQLKKLRKQVEQKWREPAAAKLSAMGLAGPKLIFGLLGLVLLLYLFHCYCCMLICQKAGHPPGILVWLPVAQLFPLLRAAGMSGWWFLAYCVPGLNIVAQVLWSLKIAKARGKNVWIGVLLLLPVFNLFAFLYLAFSDGAPATDDEDAEPEAMSLQTA